MDPVKLKAQYEALMEFENMELAISKCKAGVFNGGIIYGIRAESDYGVKIGGSTGGAERSIDCVLTKEESVKVFELVQQMLEERMVDTKARLEMN